MSPLALLAWNLGALRRWDRRSLANTFALRAALIAVVSSLVVALIFLAVIYRVEQVTLLERLQEKAIRLAERVEGSIKVVESAVFDMSRSSMFVNALLDSSGRETYLVPFLESFNFPVAAASGLALCDANGERLAGMVSELSDCHAASPLFKQVLAEGVSQRELIRLRNGHLAWTLYQGVVFPYTGTVEGVMVAQLDLFDILRSVPKYLDLDSVALVRAGTSESLVSAEGVEPSAASPSTARSLLLKWSIGEVPFPIEAVVFDQISPFENKLTPLIVGYTLGSLLLVLAVVYLARRVSQHMIRPLRELTVIAQKITDSGDLDISVPTSNEGEVGQLASALAVMVKSLSVVESTLELKVEQRTAALRKSEAAAEAANLAKSRFLTTMSHEIRTPMNGILGMAQVLLRPNLAQCDQQDYARIILTSGQTLLTLLDAILDFSKIEAGKLQLEAIAFEPGQLIRETQALFSGLASEKNLRLESQWTARVDLPVEQYYRADSFRLRQMLSNLVGNAIKFTRQGFVRIEGAEIERDSDLALLEFSISDSGIGIPTEKLDLLFQSFSQADSSTTREFGGTGLGLSLVRNLARLMGGDVGVESDVGKGSRFWFRIRAGIVPAGENGRAIEPTAQPDSEPALLGGKVLVVEDSPSNVKVLEAMLGRSTLSVSFVENGQQAVDVITGGERPDVVLMDIHTPVMDGYEATVRLRQWEATNGRPRLPIIALTADVFAEDRAHCLAVGMDDFLSKPIDQKALKRALGKWLPKPPGLALPPSTATARPVDSRRLAELVEAISPLLAHNKFDAVSRFKELRAFAAGTEIAPQIDAIGAIVASFRFDRALESLQQLVSTVTQGKKESS